MPVRHIPAARASRSVWLLRAPGGPVDLDQGDQDPALPLARNPSRGRRRASQRIPAPGRFGRRGSLPARVDRRGFGAGRSAPRSALGRLPVDDLEHGPPAKRSPGFEDMGERWSRSRSPRRRRPRQAPVGERRDDRITSRAVVLGVEWTDHDRTISLRTSPRTHLSGHRLHVETRGPARS